jgi:DNA-binding transcriptional regulator YiaG
MSDQALRDFPELDRIPVPINPVIHAALKAIYAGGPRGSWDADSYGRPLYRYETRGGHVLIFCTSPPDFGTRFHPSISMYYTPRLGFIHSGALRKAVRELSMETADVFIILMSKLAELRDPRGGIARITLEEFADKRGVKVRHGSSRALYEDFRRQILLLSDFRVMMTWKSYRTAGEITFGRDRPDRLLDILDIEYRKGEDVWSAFSFRCGQALSHFLDPEGLFWLGYYRKVLLHLNPYHEAFTKKLGTYWIMVGTVSQRKGLLPRANPKTILDFCGEEINWRNPGQTVDNFVEGHNRLQELGILDNIPHAEPNSRRKGYFREWLDSTLSVKLSDSLLGSMPAKKIAHVKRIARETIRSNSLTGRASPIKPEDLINGQSLIKRYRNNLGINQTEMARALQITRQTLSNYERSLHPIPPEKARMLTLIFNEAKKHLD